MCDEVNRLGCGKQVNREVQGQGQGSILHILFSHSPTFCPFTTSIDIQFGLPLLLLPGSSTLSILKQMSKPHQSALSGCISKTSNACSHPIKGNLNIYTSVLMSSCPPCLFLCSAALWFRDRPYSGFTTVWYHNTNLPDKDDISAGPHSLIGLFIDT